jgi:hypothetical protein
VLEELNGTGSLGGIALERLLEEVDALVAELIFGWELWWVALGNVVHDGPLVIHRSPGTTTCCHFEDDTTKGPDVNCAVSALAATTNDLGRHVHGRSGHGALAALASGIVLSSKGSTLAGNEFSGTEIDKLDDTIMVKEDVWIKC